MVSLLCFASISRMRDALGKNYPINCLDLFICKAAISGFLDPTRVMPIPCPFWDYLSIRQIPSALFAHAKPFGQVGFRGRHLRECTGLYAGHLSQTHLLISKISRICQEICDIKDESKPKSNSFAQNYINTRLDEGRKDQKGTPVNCLPSV